MESTRRTISTFVGIHLSRNTGEKKEVFSTDLGTLHMKCIRLLHSNVLSFLKRDDCPLFNGQGISERPLWLTKGTITMDHVDLVLSQKEKARRRQRRRMASCIPTAQDVGCFGVKHLNKTIGTCITNSRRRSSRLFFNILGYIFVEWATTPIRYGTEQIVVD